MGLSCVSPSLLPGSGLQGSCSHHSEAGEGELSSSFLLSPRQGSCRHRETMVATVHVQTKGWGDGRWLPSSIKMLPSTSD